MQCTCAAKSMALTKDMTVGEKLLFGLANAGKTVIILSENLLQQSWTSLESILCRLDLAILKTCLILLQNEPVLLPDLLSDVPVTKVTDPFDWQEAFSVGSSMASKSSQQTCQLQAVIQDIQPLVQVVFYS